jgi:hypothetical protein
MYNNVIMDNEAFYKGLLIVWSKQMNARENKK